MDFDGDDQAVLIRGSDRSDPIVLFLHGGPGMPSMFLAHDFQGPLEHDFVMVQWDRRGAGKSFDDEVVEGRLSVSRLLRDAEILLDSLEHRFGPEPLILVGHSWGSYLGSLLVQRHPHRFRAYVGVGQVVAERDVEAGLQEEWLRSEAVRRGDEEALSMLDELGRSAQETLLFRFGGEIAAETSFLPLVLTGLMSPEYSLLEALRVGKGSSFSSHRMVYDVEDGRPPSEFVTEYPVPAWFFTGRRDWTTPWPLIETFAADVAAQLVWFEQSAHFPFWEEPDAFALALRGVASATEGVGRP
jgi:pimeloyl-ACP methyl ester carboxylesterase